MKSSIFKSKHLAIMFVACMTLFACDKSSGQTSTPSQMGSDLIQEQLKKALSEYLTPAQGYLQPAKSLREVKKLHQLEYKVFSVSIEDSTAKYEGALEEMGKNRWDCFHVEKIFSTNSRGERIGKLFFFCKRQPETLLKYIPKSLLGR